ncbi:hypothetical protein [Roseiconus lacunae]|uniref:hypothetical protein n=1 Tax=Roseiconus lacunae TaxID=2605694 RepID=UPI0011F142A8|nr:hypothetical protein [Roseiconus lacunae]
MIQSTKLSGKRISPRKNSLSRRPLNVERLEMRTMLAATIEPLEFGIDVPPRHAVLEANYRTGASLFSTVVNLQRPRLAIEFEPAHGDEFAFTFEGEPIKVFVLEEFEHAHDLEFTEVFARLEPLRRQPSIRSAVSVVPSLVKFESVSPDNEVVQVNAPNAIPVETADTDLNLLEQTLDTLAKDRSASPVQGPALIPAQPIVREQSENQGQWERSFGHPDVGTTALPRDLEPIEDDDDEGGLIELKSFSLESDADAPPPARLSNNIWHIDLQAAPATAPTEVGGPTAPIAHPDARPVTSPTTPDGGLIKIASNQLPSSLENRGQTGLRIQLDPNVGHIRNFQLADAPGLDSDLESDPSSELVSRWERPDALKSKRITRKDQADEPQPHGVSWSGLLVAGSLLLTTSASDSDEVGDPQE